MSKGVIIGYMKVDDIFKEKDIVAQDRMLIKTTV
jgi:hypothetical protein